MNNKKQITKGSHWLPRTYLKHFLIDNKLFMYKKGERFFKEGLKAEQRVVEVLGEAGLNNIAKENNLYRVEVKDIDPNFIENLFREIIEDDLDKIIQEVKEKNIGDKIDEELKKKLCLFIATMRVRTPQFKWETNETLDKFLKMGVRLRMEASQNKPLGEAERKQAKRDYLKDKGKLITDKELDKEIEQARKKIIEGNFEGIKIVDSSNKLFLKTALSNIEPSAIIFFGMKINILKAREDRYFITSDNPVVYFVPQDKVNFYNPSKSLVSPLTEVFFPLTKDCAIHLCRRSDLKEMIMSASRELVDNFKENIAYNSKDFIFSPIKMNFLNQFVEEYIPYPFKLVSS